MPIRPSEEKQPHRALGGQALNAVVSEAVSRCCPVHPQLVQTPQLRDASRHMAGHPRRGLERGGPVCAQNPPRGPCTHRAWRASSKQSSHLGPSGWAGKSGGTAECPGLLSVLGFELLCRSLGLSFFVPSILSRTPSPAPSTQHRALGTRTNALGLVTSGSSGAGAHCWWGWPGCLGAGAPAGGSGARQSVLGALVRCSFSEGVWRLVSWRLQAPPHPEEGQAATDGHTAGAPAHGGRVQPLQPPPLLSRGWVCTANKTEIKEQPQENPVAERYFHPLSCNKGNTGIGSRC